MGIDNKNKILVNLLKLFKYIKIRALDELWRYGRLWALEWAWYTDKTNLRCAGISRICMPNPSIAAFIVFKIDSA